MVAYNAFEKGHLPGAGGLDDQPALFGPIMSIIAGAFEDERKFAENQRDSAPRSQPISTPTSKGGMRRGR